MQRTGTPPAADAAREVWDAHIARLAGFCTGVLADRELGRDVAAQAFVRLWSRWQKVDEPTAFLDGQQQASPGFLICFN